MVTHSPSSTITELTQLIDLVSLWIVLIYPAVIFFCVRHVFLSLQCVPHFYHFFGFVIARFSSSSLIYRSFFLTVAHLLLTFLPLSLVYIYLWRESFFRIVFSWFELDKASSKASSRGSKGIKVELRARHAFSRLNTRAPWHCLNHLQTRDNENKVPQREPTFYWCNAFSRNIAAGEWSSTPHA
jgi:hypothetical protein